MKTASSNGLLIINVIAVMAPVLAAGVKALKLPSAVAEIVARISVGPSVLAWEKIDQPITVAALPGLAFLLFLAGLENDLRAVTPLGRSTHRLCRLAALLIVGALAWSGRLP
jgi:Kef-type K+ transport system membrane component KefB